MFEPPSRYADIETNEMTLPDGREVRYVRRRFLPRGSDLPLMTLARIEEGSRLDLVAHATLGDSEQSWRICDANDAMEPDALTAIPGTRLRVPIPQP